MKRLSSVVAVLLTVILFWTSACNPEDKKEQGGIRVDVTGLEQVYDGTAKFPDVRLIPADAGDLYVTLYRGEEKITSAIDAGQYTVRISVRNTDEPVEDTEKTMVILPKELDLASAELTPKQYDGTNLYTGEVVNVGGIVKGDEITIGVTGVLSDAAIGNNKAVGDAEITLSGKDASNYTAQGKEFRTDVVKRQLTISGIAVEDKSADGTTNAAWSGTPVLNGVVAGETVSIEITSVSFPSPDAGKYDMVLEYTLSGKDAMNYEIAEKNGVEGNIISSTNDFAFDMETGTITGYSGTQTAVVVPSEINGVKVKKIGVRAFTTAGDEEIPAGSAVDIRQIVLPEGLEEIGAEAFAASALREITIPASVAVLGDRAFYYSSDLQTVQFAEGIGAMTWGSGLFKNTAVDGIAIPSGVTEIPDFCFEDTTGTGRFTIPQTVTKIGDSAFLRSKYAVFDFEPGVAPLVCDKQVFAGAAMSSFVFPARMVEIGGSFFQNAANLKTFTFEENRTAPLTAHCVPGAAQGFHLAGTIVEELIIPGSLGIVPNGLANNVTTLKSVTIGEGITEIGDFAFWGTLITTVHFPKTVEKIGHSVFQGCAALESVTFEKGGTADLAIGPWSFQACGIRNPLEIPARTVSLGAACFAGNPIPALTFEAGGTKPLVFEDGADQVSQGKGYQFDAITAATVVLPKRTQSITLTEVFPAGCIISYEA